MTETDQFAAPPAAIVCDAGVNVTATVLEPPPPPPPPTLGAGVKVFTWTTKSAEAWLPAASVSSCQRIACSSPFSV